MKSICILIFLSICTGFGEPMFLNSKSTEITTEAIGDIPVCSAEIRLSKGCKQIEYASLVIGGQKHVFPKESLVGIEFPDLATLRIETETGFRGEEYFSIVLSPARYTKHVTWFQIVVIDGRFSEVLKIWKEPGETTNSRRSVTLYDNKSKDAEQAVPPKSDRAGG